MLVPPAIFRLTATADIDSKRYAMGGIHFSRTADGSPIAVSTDGRTLAAVEWQESPNEPPLPGTTPTAKFAAVIPRDACQQLARHKTTKAYAAQKRFAENVILHESAYVPHSPDHKPAEGKLAATAENEKGRTSTECQVIDGLFPNWKNCIPSLADGAITISIDAALLRNLLDSITCIFDKDQTQEITIAIDAKEPHVYPICVVAENDTSKKKSVGLLMPRREEKHAGKFTPPRLSHWPNGATIPTVVNNLQSRSDDALNLHRACEEIKRLQAEITALKAKNKTKENRAAVAANS